MWLHQRLVNDNDPNRGDNVEPPCPQIDNSFPVRLTWGRHCWLPWTNCFPVTRLSRLLHNQIDYWSKSSLHTILVLLDSIQSTTWIRQHYSQYMLTTFRSLQQKQTEMLMKYNARKLMLNFFNLIYNIFKSCVIIYSSKIIKVWILHFPLMLIKKFYQWLFIWM